jgi:hypothetical protein
MGDYCLTRDLPIYTSSLLVQVIQGGYMDRISNKYVQKLLHNIDCKLLRFFLLRCLNYYFELQVNQIFV